MLKNLNNNLLTKIFKYKRNLSKFKSFQNTIDEKLIEKNFKTKENVARLPFGTIRHDINPVIINSKNFNLNDSHIKNVKNVVNKNLKLDMDLEKEFDQDCMYNEEETDENAFNFDKKDEYSNEKIIKKIRYHDPLQQMKKHGNFEKIKKIEKIKWATIKKQKNHLIHDDEINISETNLINNIFDMVKQNSVKNMDFEALDSILQDAVVFQNDTMGWVAINKPYGLPLYSNCLKLASTFKITL
ncbi:hypothetical protein A3Q56_05777 [Intoshia linei]|uniref:Uncharacterized protein n=1 Tax=Intoshia linei TaxID=1819745 RepID=A0A177AWX3_9BILA|nr:hypothetical protein A3Q56_05777 [Intoshia linei]